MKLKIEIKKIKIILEKSKSLAKIPRILAEHVFLSCLALFLFSLILGGILFYKYVFLVQRLEPEAFQKESLLKENIYKEILKIWQQEERKFQQADSKEYSNPFLKQVGPPEERSED